MPMGNPHWDEIDYSDADDPTRGINVGIKVVIENND
jgi:hypothetical protein